MDFSLQLLSVLIAMGLYKPWERVADAVCRRYFNTEVPREVCVACAITLFMIVSATLGLVTGKP